MTATTVFLGRQPGQPAIHRRWQASPWDGCNIGFDCRVLSTTNQGNLVRIVQFIALFITMFVGAWARNYFCQIRREVEADQMQFDMQTGSGCFDAYTSTGNFGRCDNRPRVKYKAPQPVEPSAVQANPFLK